MKTQDKQLNKPEPPKSRIVCDVCGNLGEQGKHTSFMCKFFNLLGSITK